MARLYSLTGSTSISMSMFTLPARLYKAFDRLRVRSNIILFDLHSTSALITIQTEVLIYCTYSLILGIKLSIRVQCERDK